MFISFNLFVLLILLTIVMIALIVYLTFTGGPSKKGNHPQVIVRPSTDVVQPEPFQHSQEPPIGSDFSEVPFLKDRAATTNPLPPSDSPYRGNDFSYLSATQVTTEETTTVSHSVQDNDPFAILPYPKDSLDTMKHDEKHTE